MKLSILICFVALLVSGCTIECIDEGRLSYQRGEAVVERLSGRVGLVTDGHWDPFMSNWKLKVKFEPSSQYYQGAAYGNGYGHCDGTVWLNAYEVRKADKPSDTARTDRAPEGDSPESHPRGDAKSPNASR